MTNWRKDYDQINLMIKKDHHQKMKRNQSPEIYERIDKATSWMVESPLYEDRCHKDIVKLWAIRYYVHSENHLTCQFCAKEVPLDKKGRKIKYCSKECAGKNSHKHLREAKWSVLESDDLYSIFKNKYNFDKWAMIDDLGCSEVMLDKRLWKINCPTNSRDLLLARESVCELYGDDPHPTNYLSHTRLFRDAEQFQKYFTSQGRSIVNVARSLNISESTVTTDMSYFWDSSESREKSLVFKSKDDLHDLLEEYNFSTGKIEKFMGLSKGVVLKECKYYGIRTDCKGNPLCRFMYESDENLLVAYRVSGEDVVKLSKWSNLGISTLRRRLANAGIVNPRLPFGKGSGWSYSKLKYKSEEKTYLYLTDCFSEDGVHLFSKVGISINPKKRNRDMCRSSPASDHTVVTMIGPVEEWKALTIENMILKHLGLVPFQFEDNFGGSGECFHPAFSNRVQKVLDCVSWDFDEVPSYMTGGSSL